MRKTAIPLILVVLGLIAGLFLAEVILRVFSLAPQVGMVSLGRYRLSDDLAIAYEMIPELERNKQEGGFWDFQDRTNSFGFRDSEHLLRKRKGVVRIAILGDSLTQGWGIDGTEKIFPKQLERELRQKKIEAEVLSFGVSGYNTGQELAVLKRTVLRFQPDLVLLQYCLNDHEGVSPGILGGLLEKQRSLSTEVVPFNRESKLFQLALFRFVNFRLLQNKRSVPVEFLAYDQSDSVERSLSEMVNIAQQEGFHFAVLIFPHFQDLMTYPRWPEHQKIQDILRKKGILFLDLLAPLQDCQRNRVESVGLDLWHPSEAGHLCAARAISFFVEKSELLSRKASSVH